ncbi:MAG TPA: hypothetical protein VMG38_02915 [Trebonia sp.]|nr:hypothetical protein [Trebonia sp.]
MRPGPARPGQRRRPREQGPPFALLDELACYHHAPDEPNNVHIEALVPGHLDERALRQAVTEAIAAAPRASGRMAAGSALRCRYRWEFPPVPDVDPLSRATWSSQDELAALRNRFLADAPPLRTSPPVRLLLATGPGESCVILNAHHAALDGISSLALLRDIAARYQAITGAREPAPAEPVPPATAAPAGRQAPASADQPQASADQPPAGRGSRRSLARALRRYPAARIATDRDHRDHQDHRDRGDRGDRGGHQDRGDRGHREDRRGRRGGHGVRLLVLPAVPRPPSGSTVTDVLVAALIATVASWNASHRRAPRTIAISVPVSVRGPGLPAVAGNRTRTVTVIVSPRTAAAQPSVLLAEVSRQLSATRQARPQETSAGILDATPGWCPVVLKRLALRVAMRTVGPVVCDTTMLSNLGTVAGPLWPGPGGPARIAFSSPVHMPRGLAVSVVTADGQLQAAFRYLYAVLDDAAAARLAEIFAATLEEFTDVEGDAHGLAGRAPGDPRLSSRQGRPAVPR